MLENKYYTAIKGLIINNEVNKSVKNYFINKTDLETKYNIGKLLSEAGKHYGEGIIKKYAIKLTNEFGKKYNYKTLSKIRQFYLKFENISTVSRTLSFSHYLELLTINDYNKINYYIQLVENNNLSVRELRNRIKSKEYERLSNETKNKLVNHESLDIKDTIPEPILIPISNIQNDVEIKEKQLESIIVENISNFMKQLGEGYCFIDNEYKIKIGDKYNYIDILLFNIKFNCYVVVELKVTELKKEYLGQIEVYMNYIDEHLKTINQNKTIGILLVKENNNYVLYNSDGNIITRTFKLK